MAGLTDGFVVVVRDESRARSRTTGSYSSYDDAKEAGEREIEGITGDVYFVIERRWRLAQPDDHE